MYAAASSTDDSTSTPASATVNDLNAYKSKNGFETVRQKSAQPTSTSIPLLKPNQYGSGGKHSLFEPIPILPQPQEKQNPRTRILSMMLKRSADRAAAAQADLRKAQELLYVYVLKARDGTLDSQQPPREEGGGAAGDGGDEEGGGSGDADGEKGEGGTNGRGGKTTVRSGKRRRDEEESADKSAETGNACGNGSEETEDVRMVKRLRLADSHDSVVGLGNQGIPHITNKASTTTATNTTPEPAPPLTPQPQEPPSAAPATEPTFPQIASVTYEDITAEVDARLARQDARRQQLSDAGNGEGSAPGTPKRKRDADSGRGCGTDGAPERWSVVHEVRAVKRLRI